MGKTIISSAGLIKRKQFFQRLFCLHYWHDTGTPDPMVFFSGKFEYLCLRCGKEKYFRNAPINPPKEWL